MAGRWRATPGASAGPLRPGAAVSAGVLADRVADLFDRLSEAEAAHNSAMSEWRWAIAGHHETPGDLTWHTRAYQAALLADGAREDYDRAIRATLHLLAEHPDALPRFVPWLALQLDSRPTATADQTEGVLNP